ncbi:MarR family winged helix-turn-helix transcriptional regulator [Pelagerythrobacter marensis]|uniref:MarR family transcriptional regulator n=1 Tax=Pelagerythrobacter marensis TaxID=543877 RepID=A0A0G3XCZ7_9SPHN|nr:MarR family transcriptional regulator [Pelagerythrobacter marensis]AKM08484.1 MarR family transcriptional regulator [Pelagerythrobacter marensis]
MNDSPSILDHRIGDPEQRDSVRLWLRLLACTRTIEKQVRRRFADRYDITLPRFDIMAALDRHPEGMTMGQLSQALLVSNGNVTGVVQALVRDGYVGVAPSPTDGRSSIVRLTEQGRQCFDGLAEAHQDWIDAMLGGLERDQQGALLELLGTLKDSLAAQIGKEEA